MANRGVRRNVLMRSALLAVIAALTACGGSDDGKNTVGSAYGDAVAKLPDWNGRWLMTGGTSHTDRLMFDPEHVYAPPDPAGETGGLDFGPLSGTRLTDIPYNDEYKKKYADIIANIMAGRNPDPVGNCQRPHGMPRQMGGIPSGPEVIMTPGFVLMSWEPMGAQRRIYFDGRPHPEDHAADYMGSSIGKWDGDTLVVDTVGMVGGIYDQSGAPFSDKVHLTERIRLISKDVLEDEMTIEDPVTLTRPWKVTRRYQRSKPRYPTLLPYYCPPGTAVDYVDGYQKVVLPSERGKK